MARQPGSINHRHVTTEMKPTYYYKTHVDRLQNEAKDRFGRLMAALDGRPVTIRGKECLDLDGSRVRVAVDDFTNILKELRRLK
jgi:hypothetical protein